jgi:[protein-PII] uridylyltransferase
MSLLAIGALGRSELGPHSDLDLVLLCDAPPSENDPAFEEWMQSLVHPLWDMGFRLRTTVHDPESWIAAAEEDLTLCSALLDVRHLAGDAELERKLTIGAHARLFGERRETFIHRLRDEVDDRHPRYGDTVYRVEPDLKYGPGGLRDLAVTGWCVAATHGHRDLEALARESLVGPRVANMLIHARDVLLRLRAALQLAAKRPQDRLVFQYQELIPSLLGTSFAQPREDADLVQVIEAFMQDYYRAATTVLRYGRRVCARCLPPSERPEEDRRIDERFHIVGNVLCHYESDPFRETPVLALAALMLARNHRVRLSGQTFDCIAEAVAAPAASRLAEEPEAQRRFMDLLVDPSDGDSPSVLELCNELGLLERVLPEFGPSRGRMQHDTYHVYTVDQHTLNAVGFLKSIARGEHRKDFPLATALHLELDDPKVLYLATLVHDLGKGWGGDQCEKGAEVARAVAGRAGFDEAETDRCQRLVREHLKMPLFSQKRDLGDPLLIESLASTVGDRETLRELYLLSLADMAQVRPGNLTSWKRALLDELYLMTVAHLCGDERRARPPRAREGEPQGLPERYYALFDVDMRRHHATLVERLTDDRRAALLDLVRGPGALRLTLVARDRPGLLAQMTALLDEREMMVIAADVFTVPGESKVALDVFRLQPRGDSKLDVAGLTEMEHALSEGFDPKAPPPPPLPRPRWTAQRRIATRVSFDSDPAGYRTIVEVETLDRPGVLRRITLAFAALGVEILLARCLTEAHRVSDVFYVSALDDSERDGLARRLAEYLGGEAA